jgi:CheY-like chemotaxis protein
MSTILLVDDEVLLREGVQEILELHGFHVVCAADGQEALDLLANTPVELVITDLAMPNMNGVDFTRRCTALFPALPVIVASGCSYSLEQRLGIDSPKVPGAMASIRKPFKGTELVALIEEVAPDMAACASA